MSPTRSGDAPDSVLLAVLKRILEPTAVIRVTREESSVDDRVHYSIACEAQHVKLLIGRSGMTAKTIRSLVLLMERSYSGRRPTVVIEGDLGLLHKRRESGEETR